MSVRSKDGFPWIGEFAERLLRAQTESGDPLYRMTSGPHSDIEYFYALEFPGFQTSECREREAYVENAGLLKFRWARGFGQELEATTLAKPPQTSEEFWRDIARNADQEQKP